MERIQKTQAMRERLAMQLSKPGLPGLLAGVFASLQLGILASVTLPAAGLGLSVAGVDQPRYAATSDAHAEWVTDAPIAARNDIGLARQVGGRLLEFFVGDAHAAEDERKTRQTAALSQKVYEKLTEAQALVEAGDVQAGLDILEGMRGNARLTAYETAQLYNYLAYTYFTLERYSDAIKAYKVILEQPDLPAALAQNSLYTLAQLYFTVEDYRSAVESIKRWFEAAPEPTETAWLLLAQGYYQLGQYQNVIEPVDKAIELMQAQGKPPEERLLLLKRAAYYELGDYKSLASVMRQLVDLYPRKGHWMTLAAAYSELGDTRRQMVIMEMLFEAGELERAEQVRNLANLYLLHKTPYKAARLLDQQMEIGKLEQSEANLRLLAQAWQQAHEDSEAIAPLAQAAALASGGELYLRLAQSQLNLGRYADAAASLETALARGGIERPDQARIMLGLAWFELDRLAEAREAFVAAAADERSRKTAQQWLDFIASERARRAALTNAQPS